MTVLPVLHSKNQAETASARYEKIRFKAERQAVGAAITIHYRFRQTTYHLTFTRLAAGVPAAGQLILDGQELAGPTIPLRDDRRDHSVVLNIQ